MRLCYLEAALLLAAVAAHICLAPFTKVEESFNMQATYDLLYKPWTDVPSFDHIEFPGVVPRTFTAPIVLSALSFVPKWILRLPPFATLHVMRMTLATITVASLLTIRESLAKRFTVLTGTMFTLITLTQFHLLFYASRTLPNIFALILTNFAFAARLRSRSYLSIAIMSVACALFRSELCLYIFTTLVIDLAVGNLQFLNTCAVGLVAAVSAAVFSIVVDSYFWQRLCYPELEVFYFNVVLNKSSAWGTHDVHWYFTNALPRALGGSYLLAFVGTALRYRQLLPLMLPVVLFVCMYSALPHKELRFIFYALPVFNAAAAVAVDGAFREVRAGMVSRFNKKTDGHEKARAKRWSFLRLLKTVMLAGLSVATLGASLLQTVVSSAASHANYPSAYAMRAMHESERNLYEASGLCRNDRQVSARVHIDVDSAMKGITQFLEKRPDEQADCPRWTYSKREDVENIDWSEFTHLISEKAAFDGFCVIHVEDIFDGLEWRKMKMLLSPHTYVHRNMNVSTVGCRDADEGPM